MKAGAHWEQIYNTIAPDGVSWYCRHLEKSLALIERAAGGSSTSIIDVGGGASTLVDDLLGHGFENVTVLDISQTALDLAKTRLGPAAQRVHWLLADVTHAALPLPGLD